MSLYDKDDSWMVKIVLPFKDLYTEHTTQVTAKTKININFCLLDENHGMELGHMHGCQLVPGQNIEYNVVLK